MATKSQNNAVSRFPEVLTLRDIVTIVSVAISLALAWGVFSTRITLLEREVIALHTSIQNNEATIDRLSQQIRNLESRQQDSELLIDQLYISLKRPIPARRAGRFSPS